MADHRDSHDVNLALQQIAEAEAGLDRAGVDHGRLA